MTDRRRLELALVCAFSFGLHAIAGAHRLDEYLQATRIAVGLTRVDVEIDLTPGASIASSIYGSIDSNHDGELSDMERTAYARLVVSSALLEADGRAAPLTLVNQDFPSLDAMREGTGAI